jgi:hypothetical protein
MGWHIIKGVGRASSLVISVILLCVCSEPLPAQSLPDLAKVKAAAENGDAEAQAKLADAYSSSFNFSEAAKWYRAAAEQGHAPAQCELGKLCLRGAPAMGGGHKVSPNPREGVQWLLRSANQDHLQAEVALGTCYKDGTGVTKDLTEAYKWYTLAAKRDGIWGKMYRDPIILKMSSQEIAEGEKRASAFQPSAIDASPYLAMLTLKGISGSKDHRMAIINNSTFSVGEVGDVKVGTSFTRIKCVEIKDKSAIVILIKTRERTELVLK